MVEVESRPNLRKDWSLDLNFSDSYHWSEPPILHVLGRDIALTKYAEPSIRKQLGRIRSHAREAARRLDLHDKAAKAWEQAFQPDPDFAGSAGLAANYPGERGLRGRPCQRKRPFGLARIDGHGTDAGRSGAVRRDADAASAAWQRRQSARHVRHPASGARQL